MTPRRFTLTDWTIAATLAAALAQLAAAVLDMLPA